MEKQLAAWIMLNFISNSISIIQDGVVFLSPKFLLKSSFYLPQPYKNKMDTAHL